MRPRRLAEVLGQPAVAGPDTFLARAIERDQVPSLIFWGPPGSGKTTLARILAEETAARFVPFSAVTSGIKEVRTVMAEAQRRRSSARTLLFVDEIHRFNRAQQDAFLPYVESGAIVLLGATTENPSFALNAALLSRCRVLVLEPLPPEAVEALARCALADEDRGLGALQLALADDAVEPLVALADGDGRKALNLLEQAALDASAEAGGDLSVERWLRGEHLQRVAQRKMLLYDKSGEEHFNLISALHKSLRESDPQAAVYWLCRMLESGEDPLYLARRMLRFASEDVGLAEPRAMEMAVAAWESYRRLGSPEGELALVQLAVYLAMAPKSNAVYTAYKAAKALLAERPADPVPKVIRNAPTGLMKELGYGKGYVYAHDTEEGVGGLSCLPDALEGTRFYQPRDSGFERRLRERLEQLEASRQRARKGRP
ncbi:MAG: replication-associated recombination protein A [Acidobacteriota bacterium]